MYVKAVRSRDHTGLSPDTAGTEYVLVETPTQIAVGPKIEVGAAIGVDATMVTERDAEIGDEQPEGVTSDTALIKYVPAVFQIMFV
jgi:hypothetical protein